MKIFFLLFIFIVYTSALVKRAQTPNDNDIGDLNDPGYRWELTLYSNNEGAFRHDLIMAVPYSEDGKTMIQFKNSLDGKYTGARYRMELIFKNPIGTVEIGGVRPVSTLDTRMQMVEYETPTGYSFQRVKYMTSGTIDVNNLRLQFKQIAKGRFGTGAIYLAAGNNCQDFGKALMNRFQYVFPGESLLA
jgi:hypothetical protein